MNLLVFLILALAYLIGFVIIKQALDRTKNDRATNDEPSREKKMSKRNARGVRTKVIIGRLWRT